MVRDAKTKTVMTRHTGCFNLQESWIASSRVGLEVSRLGAKSRGRKLQGRVWGLGSLSLAALRCVVRIWGVWLRAKRWGGGGADVGVRRFYEPQAQT